MQLAVGRQYHHSPEDGGSVGRLNRSFIDLRPKNTGPLGTGHQSVFQLEAALRVRAFEGYYLEQVWP